ncbi:MAG: GTP-binding protein, partial [Gordonia sp. (in: high G+C Gram-positive bacteria)]
MSRPSVPVVVLAGFLGAGKTTVLNHLLRTGGVGGRARLGVLVNDFGAVNIDAMLVAGQADGAVSLTNGCMCCAVDSGGLTAAIGALLRPSSGIDAIVIEASGIAEPKALIRMIVGAADARMHYGGLVYVVDAAHFGAVRRTHPELDDHLAIADLVVLNKCDLISEHDRHVLKQVVEEINSTAPSIEVVDGAVDAQLLFDRLEYPDSDEAGPRQLTLDELLDETQHASDQCKNNDG